MKPSLLLTLGAHAHEGYSNHFVCVSVCVSVPSLLPSNGANTTKLTLLSRFSPVFLDFQLTDKSKMPSFPRKSAFHGYFVVSDPYKRLCILLVV